MGDQTLYAHSLEGYAPGPDWELLAPHLSAVAERAGAFATPFGGEWARAAGLLHDIGKASDTFQRRIRGAKDFGVDHSTAGAREAVRLYGSWGKLIAFAVAGHHAGLADGAGDGSERRPLAQRLDEAKTPIENYARWRECVEDLPDLAALKAEAAALRPSAAHPAFTIAFFTRMIFSALVDADFLATENFYNSHRPLARGGELCPEYLALVRERTEGKRAGGEVNALRAAILDHAVARAALPPGLFTLTVPTGGGKTLTSLRFALEHAAAHGLRRVVYVIPFTSIIEQTAEVFRDEMGLGDAVLEHHSSFDWDGRATGDAEAGEALAKLRRDTENWDAPIVVTTAVQFWESLFAARTRPCRKLHNLARSVIVLDEVQTLPVPLLLPCLAALEELTRNYGATAVLCTATQPALAKQDGALPVGLGLDIATDRELAPDPRGLYERLKRVRVEWMRDKVTDETIAARFAEAPQMLCIVNSRRHARDLFERIRRMDGARHLTTLMCARHRREVLAGVREDLAQGRPVRLVATSLIEAGVDVSFPEVWRAAAGLDSVAQAAGRCNRSGELGALGEAFGRTVVFEPADAAVPSAIKGFYQAARPVLGSGADPLGLAAIQAYFRELYFQKEGLDALDAATIDGRVFRIMAEIDVRRMRHDYPFASIARAFRLIDEVMDPVLIPYDAEAEAALRTLELAERPPGEVLRRLQQYVVSVPSRVRQALLAVGAAQPIRPDAYGERFIRLETMDSYDKELGVRFDDPTFRSAEGNVWQ